ncbi:LuxR C-terminal-related transcriptional regulator [Actinoplanes sp. CA-131856]
MSVHDPSPPGTDERARLDDLVRAAAAGDGCGLRIVGEPGIGESSGVDYAIGQAAGFRVVRIRPVAAEREMPYAALHLLWVELFDDNSSLAAAHQEALNAAFGLAGDARPSAASVGSAMLEQLDSLAASGPVCLAVDDAHCLDNATAEVLAHIARRAGGRPMLVVLAHEPTDRLTCLDKLPTIAVAPLDREGLENQLPNVALGPLDPDVADRLLQESHGKMRLLAQFLQGFTEAELAGGFAIPTPRRRRSCTHEQYCPDRAAELTPTAWRLLLAAAADSSGDLARFGRMSAELGADPDCLISAGFVEAGNRITFTCPELRLVTYHSAPPEERRLIHRMISENADDDRTWQVWHNALAATGHDDVLADRLEDAADSAQSRGGIAARSVFLEKAALLTSDPARRDERALAASTARYDSGDFVAAQRILGMVAMGAPGTTGWARRVWHLARIDTVVHPGAGSVGRLLDAARLLRPYDPANAREAYLEALLAAMSAAAGDLLIVAATEARAAMVDPVDHPADLILHGLSTRILDGYARSVDPLRAAVTAFRTRSPDPRTSRWLGLAGLVAVDLWDAPAWTDLAARSPRAERGMNLMLPVADAYGVSAGTRPNRTETALDRCAIARLVSRPAGTALAHPLAGPPSGWRWRPHREDVLSHMTDRVRGHDAAVAAAVAAAAIYNAAGHYDQVASAVREAVCSEHPGFTGWALVELVEAAVRTGDVGLASSAAARLSQRTTAAGTDWALGVQAIADALLADDQHAEALFAEAVDRLSLAGIRCQLARADLLYGEWLRRKNRRIDARVRLRAADDHFTALGAVSFAERSRGEILATGEATRKRTAENRRRLTPQEARVSSLARAGCSNSEIAEQLFVSTRTVEYHLYKAFAKLGVNSRAKLPALPDR